MELGFSPEKIGKVIKKNKDIFYLIAGLIVVSFVIYAVYLVVNIPEVKSESVENEEKSIIFDKKFLQELETKQSPPSIEGVGGRNPFLPY
jgi:hypothetical protein